MPRGPSGYTGDCLRAEPATELHSRDTVAKPLRRALLVLLVAAVLVAAALAIAQDQETLRLRSAVAADDAASPDYLAALAGAAVSRGNSFDVLQNGVEILPAMLEAIAAARERISFETFIFEDGQVARDFVQALTAAARRGVEVRLVIDDLGASGVAPEHLDALRAAGCTVRSYNRAAWYELEEVNYRTHRKILVVDGRLAFTGGVGVADHWLGNAEDPDHWRDTQVRMRGPVARLLEASFYENFIEGTDIVTPALADPQAIVAAGHEADAPTLVVRSSATDGSSDMKRLYLMIIASARRTIDITTPYFVSDESSRWALHDAASRGVRIRLLTEGDVTDAPPVKYASRRSYDGLLAAGLEIHEYLPTMMHTKTMVVDGAWSMFGSANFDNRSLELNDELNVAVYDRALAATFAAAFERDLSRSHHLTLEAFRSRPVKEKAREWFWGYWGELF